MSIVDVVFVSFLLAFSTIVLITTTYLAIKEFGWKGVLMGALFFGGWYTWYAFLRDYNGLG
jgi:hypothetical protein